jgi:hypothetical protein
MQAKDQFGDNVDSLYAGQEVFEAFTGKDGPYTTIARFLSNSGTYVDPTGPTDGRVKYPGTETVFTFLIGDEDKKQVPGTNLTVNQWLAQPVDPPTNAKIDGTFFVRIGGWTMTVHRIWNQQPTGRFTARITVSQN